MVRADSGCKSDGVTMRVLLTGVSGFAGSHLAECILANHPESALTDTFQISAIGQVHLFEAVLATGLDPLIHAVLKHRISSARKLFGF